MRVVLVTLMMVKKVATLMKEWKGSLIGLRPNASKVHDVQCTLQFAQCKVHNGGARGPGKQQEAGRPGGKARQGQG